MNLEQKRSQLLNAMLVVLLFYYIPSLFVTYPSWASVVFVWLMAPMLLMRAYYWYRLTGEKLPLIIMSIFITIGIGLWAYYRFIA